MQSGKHYWRSAPIINFPSGTTDVGDEPINRGEFSKKMNKQKTGLNFWWITTNRRKITTKNIIDFGVKLRVNNNELRGNFTNCTRQFNTTVECPILCFEYGHRKVEKSGHDQNHRNISEKVEFFQFGRCKIHFAPPSIGDERFCGNPLKIIY